LPALSLIWQKLLVFCARRNLEMIRLTVEKTKSARSVARVETKRCRKPFQTTSWFFFSSKGGDMTALPPSKSGHRRRSHLAGLDSVEHAHTGRRNKVVLDDKKESEEARFALAIRCRA
jgi:hypothetical protein